jgi:hypothetical protein
MWKEQQIHVSSKKAFPNRKQPQSDYLLAPTSTGISGTTCNQRETTGRVVAQALVAGPGAFIPGSNHMGFVVDTAALRRVCSKYFRSHCHSFVPLIAQHHQHLLSRAVQ